MWHDVARLALSLLHEDPRYRGETLDGLKAWIRDTTYPGAGLEPDQ
jgi:hypothetical protein